MNTEPIFSASQSPVSSHGSPLSQSTHTTTQTQPTEPNPSARTTESNPSSHTTESQPEFQPRRSTRLRAPNPKYYSDAFINATSTHPLPAALEPSNSSSDPVQLKMRLPRNHVEKIGESRDEAEVARKIFHLCLQNSDDYYLV
nr:vegetative cell wall protein gp1-like [Ipomoea batatas]